MLASGLSLAMGRGYHQEYSKLITITIYVIFNLTLNSCANSFPSPLLSQDTFAILLAAYHPAIRILGVSTVFGNASLE
jgi:Inosine-uridine nucleoside N-ribohydrolase